MPRDYRQGTPHVEIDLSEAGRGRAVEPKGEIEQVREPIERAHSVRFIGNNMYYQALNRSSSSALISVYDALERHRSSRTGLARVINRGLDELNEHDRRLDELNTQLILVRVVLFRNKFGVLITTVETTGYHFSHYDGTSCFWSHIKSTDIS
jgi:hypothetical protein